VKLLSGGQKSRVAFAVLAFKRPHLLVMDEPTNHLDMETIDALTAALKEFDGAVVAVTHDQHFVNSVCDRLWTVGAGKVVPLSGDFNAYKKQILKEVRTE
jgi:ATP-binding cassette subfamily F protein 3